MYKYKRGIDDINSVKNMQFVLTNSEDTCLSLTALLEAKKIYNGLYIKNGKILVENLIEKVELKKDTYRVGMLSTSKTKISSEEYVTNVDLENSIFEYNVEGFSYKKIICFDESSSDILMIKYELNNNSKSKVNFSVIPLLTYRDLMEEKTFNMLKFNHRENLKSVYINLSVTNNSNIFLASDNMEFAFESNFIKDVNHEFVCKDLSKRIFTEDLYVPGNFEISLKQGEQKEVCIYISTNEFDIKNVKPDSILEKYQNSNRKMISGIADEFVELKDMAIAMKNSYLNLAFASTTPCMDFSKKYDDKIYMENLINLVRSIEGKYLILNKVDEAKKQLLSIVESVKKIDEKKIEDEEVLKNVILLRLWLIESINRYLQKVEGKNVFFDFIRESVMIINKNEKIKKLVLNNIELISLYYNLLKVYDYFMLDFNTEDTTSYVAQQEVLKIIDEEFWIEDKRILKENLDDENHIAKISMIYALSLSYPLITDMKGIKLLDTIFKELYTPYGMREYSKVSEMSDGLIYPKYMAHFVKANLRQNGITRASQKLAYNLVKELILDISKHVSGGVRKIYSDKGILVDSLGYDSLTNAEVIRLYSMLT